MHGDQFQLLQIPGLSELFKTSIVGFFSLSREAACRKLLHTKMVFQAVAAYSFFPAGIGTIAVFQVFFFLAFHFINQPSINIICIMISGWMIKLRQPYDLFFYAVYQKASMSKKDGARRSLAVRFLNQYDLYNLFGHYDKSSDSSASIHCSIITRIAFYSTLLGTLAIDRDFVQFYSWMFHSANKGR